MGKPGVRIKMTSDTEFAEMILDKLRAKDFYCPCRLEKTPETKCMCRDFKDMVEKGIEGWCHCGLYQTVREEE